MPGDAIGEEGERSPRRAWLAALGVALLLQTTTSLLLRSIPVLGPDMTGAARLPSEWIGHLSGIHAAGSIAFMLIGSAVLLRFGPVRSSQGGVVVGALALAAMAFGEWPVLVLAAALLGLGYGPAPPSGSEILARHAPPGHRSLIFSIKQSGVPLGGVIAGLVLPPAILAFGWQWAAALMAGLALIAAALVEPARRRFDAGRGDAAEAARVSLARLFSPANLKAPFAALFAARGLLPLTVGCILFSSVQGAFIAVFVSYLTAEIGYSLAVAGAAFSATQIASFGARVVMGWVADRIGSGVATLAILAAASCVAIGAVATIGQGWGIAALSAVAIFAGFASTSWNGVYLAEVARLAPPGRVGDATSGSTIFIFLGYFAGPIAFALGVALLGSYRAAFVGLALLPLAALPCFAFAWRAQHRAPVPR
jgi:MFS family permease